MPPDEEQASRNAQRGIAAREGEDEDTLAGSDSDAGPATGSEPPLLGETVAPSSPRPRDLRELDALPEVVRDRYRVRPPFARGGIGTISRAVDLGLGRTVALKELRRGSSYARVRFAREIRITARLSHPNIVPLYEAARWPGGEPFFAMKLVEGVSLDEAIARCEGRQERMDLLGHVADAADAIAYAHSQHVVHRDIKPANVLVGPFGETVVIDWGLAKDQRDPQDDELPAPDSETRTERYQTTDGAVMGTPPYMAPEQAEGQPVDERADVYALGAILYHLLSGKIPYFEDPPGTILDRVIAGPPTPLSTLEPDLPADLLAIADKAMARDLEARYRSAEKMAEELGRFRSGRLVEAYAYSRLELVERFVARHKISVTIATLAAVLLTCLAMFSVYNIARERDRAEEARQAAEQSAQAEANARADAEERLEEAILASAQTALSHDPTRTLALLKRLRSARPGAPTLAADALERGVAQRVLTGQSERIDALALSPDGARIVAAGVTGTISSWRGGELTQLTLHRDRVPAVAFTPDGRLVSVGYDGRIVLWEGSEASLIAKRPAPMRAVAVTDTTAIVMGNDGVGSFALDGLEERRFHPTSSDRPSFAVVSPDGRRALTGSHGARVWLHDLSSEGEPTAYEHPAEVRGGAFSPEGKRFATGCADGVLRVFGIDDGSPSSGSGPTHTFEAHRGAVEAVAFLDAGTVVSGGFDGVVRLWHLDSERDEILVEHGERVVSVAVSPSRSRVASASWDKTVTITDRAHGTSQRLRGHDDVVSSIAFFPDDDEALVSGGWDREVRLWRLDQPRRRRFEAHRVGVKAVAFSPDGKLLASGGHDDAVRLWRVSDAEPIHTWRGHRDHVFRVIFSPDGNWVASSSDDLTVRLWPVRGGEPRTLEGHTADVEEIAFSPEGAHLASAAEDDQVGLWDVRAGTSKMLRGHQDAVSDVAFGERWLASSSRDCTVRLWDPKSGAHRSTWTLDAAVTAIAFRPGKSTLAAVSGSDLWLRDLDSGKLQRLPGVQSGQRVAWSPKGTHLATGGAKGTVSLCRLTPARCDVLDGHDARIHALVFTPDGKKLLSASGDGTVRIWDVVTRESAPVRIHHAPVFDLALSPDGATAASASGDMTIAFFPPKGPPAPADLASFLAEATDYVVP